MANLKSETLLELSSENGYKDGTRNVLQVIRWINMDNPQAPRVFKPKLEKREYFTDAEGQEKTGKAGGFSAADLALYKANMEKVDGLIANPPTYKAPEPTQEEIEQVPF